MSTPAPGTPKTLPTTISLPGELRGRRVLIRPYELTDAAAVGEAVRESREALRPWMPWWETHKTIEESIDFCTRSKAHWLLRQNLNLGIFALEEGREGRYLGGTGFHRPDWDARAFEIGYWLRASAVGSGHMTESVRVLTRAAFEQMGANQGEIRCDARNTRSRSVAERCGYPLEGTLRRSALGADGLLRDTLVFALIREEYEALLSGWADAFPVVG